MALLSQKQFCVESVNDGEGTMTVPLICVPKSAQIPAVVYYIYSGGESNETSALLFLIHLLLGMLVSSVFFLLTAIIFIVTREESNIRGKCVIAYTLSMAASFICLSLAQIGRVEGDTCNVFGKNTSIFF